MLVLTRVSSRKTKRSGSRPTPWRAWNSRRSAATSGRCRSAATGVFFERDLQGGQGVPQGSEADVEAEPGPQRFEGEVGLFGDGGPEFRFVAAVERRLLDAGRPGGDFAGGLEAADELAGPFGADGVFAAEAGEVEAGLEILEDALAQVEGVGSHGGSTGGGEPRISQVSSQSARGVLEML